MNREEATIALLALHKPEAHKNQMVYSVWEDGEVTVEKGGELFGQRKLHTVRFGGQKSVDYARLPYQNTLDGHGRIFVDNDIEAAAASLIIREMEQ
jgi:hypothetical protein